MAARRRPRDGAPPDPAAAPPAASREVRKGRGATLQIASHLDPLRREPDCDAFDAACGARCGGSEMPALAPPVPTTVAFEQARCALARNDSPDIPFDRSINPYRGCEHGCIYCYARPTHGYLNLSPGLDFETRLIAKVNLAERLRDELAAPGYRPAVINIGSATDAYQPVERRLQLTRSLIAVLAGCGHPFTVITKSSLVERDLDLLSAGAAQRLCAVFISLTTLDAALSRRLEPRAASPARRLSTIHALARAGVPVHVNVAPLIPFINEPELERLLEAARDAGARAAHYTVLRLPWEVAPLFRDWLAVHFPQRAARVMARVRELHDGRDDDARFGVRMTGSGTWAKLLQRRFARAIVHLGLAADAPALDTGQFVPPRRESAQLALF